MAPQTYHSMIVTVGRPVLNPKRRITEWQGWSLAVDGLTRHTCSRRSFSTRGRGDTNWFRLVLVAMFWK
jgi:hypothetical protein